MLKQKKVNRYALVSCLRCLRNYTKEMCLEIFRHEHTYFCVRCYNIMDVDRNRKNHKQFFRLIQNMKEFYNEQYNRIKELLGEPRLQKRYERVQKNIRLSHQYEQLFKLAQQEYQTRHRLDDQRVS